MTMDYENIRKQIMIVRDTYYTSPYSYFQELAKLKSVISEEIGQKDEESERYLPVDQVESKLVFVRDESIYTFNDLLDWLLSSTKPNAIADLFIGAVIDYAEEFAVEQEEFLCQGDFINSPPDAFDSENYEIGGEA
jgi:hypothetical protein